LSASRTRRKASRRSSGSPVTATGSGKLQCICGRRREDQTGFPCVVADRDHVIERLPVTSMSRNFGRSMSARCGRCCPRAESNSRAARRAWFVSTDAGLSRRPQVRSAWVNCFWGSFAAGASKPFRDGRAQCGASILWLHARQSPRGGLALASAVPAGIWAGPNRLLRPRTPT